MTKPRFTWGRTQRSGVTDDLDSRFSSSVGRRSATCQVSAGWPAPLRQKQQNNQEVGLSKPRVGAPKRVAVGLLAGALGVFGIALAPNAGATATVTTSRLAGSTRY